MSIAFIVPSGGQCPLDIGEVFTLLGVTDVDEAFKYVFPSDKAAVGKPSEIVRSALNRTADSTVESVMARLTECIGMDRDKTETHIASLLRNEFLPHCGISSSKHVLKRKLLYYGCMIRRLASVLCGLTQPCDRDATVNKRVHGVGEVS